MARPCPTPIVGGTCKYAYFALPGVAPHPPPWPSGSRWQCQGWPGAFDPRSFCTGPAPARRSLPSPPVPAQPH
eukprot:scaffold31902_cov45-Isochrysis_galbana.AAC.1